MTRKSLKTKVDTDDTLANPDRIFGDAKPDEQELLVRLGYLNEEARKIKRQLREMTTKGAMESSFNTISNELYSKLCHASAMGMTASEMKQRHRRFRTLDPDLQELVLERLLKMGVNVKIMRRARGPRRTAYVAPVQDHLTEDFI